METRKIQDFFDPTLNTRDLELCHTLNWVEFDIDELYFEPERNRLSLIRGKINGINGWEKMEWNANGEAVMGGKRIKDYDLIRPREQQKEVESSGIFLIALLIMASVVIFLIISKWI